MKIVVDTNVLIAGAVAEGLCRDIVKRRLPACELFTSRALLAELAEKLHDKFDLNPTDLPFLRIYEDEATVVKFAIRWGRLQTSVPGQPRCTPM